MLDVPGSIFVTFYIGSILALVVRRAADSRALGRTSTLLLFWVGVEIAIALGIQGLGLSMPPNLAMFSMTITLLTAAWLLVPTFRRVASETKLEALLGLHAWRLGGFFFLLLYAAARLPAPFAQVAAIGDIIAGAGAAALAIATLRSRRPAPQIIRAWNAFGLLDLVAAVSLALLSTPGAPFQLFTDVPAQSAFTQLPWILVPAAIVPALFFVHLAIFRKLAASGGRSLDWHAEGARA